MQRNGRKLAGKFISFAFSEITFTNFSQTKVTHILTSHELLPKFRKILLQTPTVTTVIYFEDQIRKTDTTGETA
jgi:predicted oxidoreductase (fatty acid repression mutant protein)